MFKLNRYIFSFQVFKHTKLQISNLSDILGTCDGSLAVVQSEFENNTLRLYLCIHLVPILDFLESQTAEILDFDSMYIPYCCLSIYVYICPVKKDYVLKFSVCAFYYMNVCL